MHRSNARDAAQFDVLCVRFRSVHGLRERNFSAHLQRHMCLPFAVVFGLSCFLRLSTLRRQEQASREFRRTPSHARFMRHVGDGCCYQGGPGSPALELVCEPHIRTEDIRHIVTQLECGLRTRPVLPSPVRPQYDVLRMSAEQARTADGESTFSAAWGAGLPIVITGVMDGLSDAIRKDFAPQALLQGLDGAGLFVESSFNGASVNGSGGAGLAPDYEQRPVPDMTVRAFLAEYNKVPVLGGSSTSSGPAAKVKDLPPDRSFQEWRPYLYSVFIALLVGIAPTYVGAAALNLLNYFPALNRKPDCGPKAYISCRGALDDNRDPVSGQTNLHADMSHAVNLAVSARKGCTPRAVVATWDLWHRDDQAAVPPSRSVVWALVNRAGVLRPPSAAAHVHAHAGTASDGDDVPLPACNGEIDACR